ncbi:MAG: hypothetical protein DMF68_08070 [Acidobacteria bacterium]|nr:MAG: hypothetical protein DMF68_08070 [Acidobacteriota bacterium]
MKKLFSTLISTALVLSIFSFSQAGAQTRGRASARSTQQRRTRFGYNEKKIREANRRLRYTITAKYPQFIVNGTDERISNLNSAINSKVAKEIADFKKDFEKPETRMGPAGSSFDVSYSVEISTNDLVSIIFYIDSFYEGAAHGLHVSDTFNYNLDTGKELNLADLFKPNSGYLNLISKHTISDLKKQLGPDSDKDWIEKGAGPSEENFKSWNVTRKGLEITFDPYQVASYAEGPHEVVVPFSVLRSAIEPNGPLAKIAR